MVPAGRRFEFLDSLKAAEAADTLPEADTVPVPDTGSVRDTVPVPDTLRVVLPGRRR